ncbi:MAG: site-specific DNA-methyltransferase, partial [Clostridiales bacterium]|nr:site-specific DNA-methyltransferase [Clostridiales bacterium]
MEKLEGKTKDILKENIAKLKEIFPEAFAEDKINFEKLQEILGEDIEKGREIYEFTWPGKSEALKLSQKTSTGTLRPDKAASKDWDKTKNLYIEGDNLEVLKLLQRSYYKKIKMIYIDPPYNTGNDFVYKDDFRDNIKNYKELTLQSMKANPETSGIYHSDCLNVMYPRLRLAKNLLRHDGVIFISIDDNEVHNLRKACDEVFGEENFVATVIWERAFSPKNDTKYFSENHDYMIIYAKGIQQFSIGRLPRTKEANERYGNLDNDPRGEWAPTDLSAPAHDNDDKRIYDIVSPTGKAYRKCWAYAYEN